MTTRPIVRNLLLTAAVTVLLAACSGASTPGATTIANGAATGSGGTVSPVQPATAAGAGASGADACALLTKSDVEAAFGETMIEPVSAADHGDPTCTWMHAAGGLDLTVSISSHASSAAAIKQAEGLYGDMAHDLPGIGDAAFEVAGILEFVKGTTLVTIGSGDGPAIITDAKFQALTQLAAGRI